MPDDDADEEQDLSEEDIEALLNRLLEGGERQRQVRELHPDADMLAEVLRIYADLLDGTLQVRHLERLVQIAEAGETLSEWEEMRWHPADDSTAAKDSAWASAQPVEWNEDPVLAGLKIVQGITASAIDHLRGTAVLMRATDLVRSPIAAARSALEACATLAFIVDPDVQPAERLRRVSNMRLMQLEEERRESEGDLQRDVADQIAHLLANCEALGLQPTKDSRKKPGGRNFPGLVNRESVQAMIEALLKGVGEDVYRSMSAVAHSREAATLFLVDPMAGYEDERRRNYEVTRHSIGVVIAVVMLVPRLAAYLGWDLGPVSETDQALQRVWSIGAGFEDDAIRGHLFGDPDDSSDTDPS